MSFSMKKGRGRTSRIRRRKRCLNPGSGGVTESHKPEFVALKKWLRDRKFEDTNLIPAHFPGTGRGLMTKTSLQEGQMVISLPESCLLTTDTVMRSSIGAHLAKWQPPPSPLLALCTFLVAERHAGARSLWKPYLDVLPKAYTCPVCWEPEAVALLPAPLRAQAEEQRARVWRLFTSSRRLFSSLQPLFAEAVESIFSYRALRWAWCTVNTRAVYMTHRQRPGCSAEPDTCALAPYLDLLNHSPHAQVKAAFNEETRRYEVRTGARWGRHAQVFICYGPHDSQRLLLEYGFVCSPNPHACVYVTEGGAVCPDHRGGNLTFGREGPSWRLLTALKLLCLEPGEITSWKKVLRGEMISETNEKASLDVAREICRCLAEEADAALEQISYMKTEEGALASQLTLVEALWTEALQILQASAEALNRLPRASA
ncbi:PREDICTED: SET domain-containing protein 4 isoform X2 [Condylura cristata]|uniref:SET domain-containing protein 4 isoform X2 n=1 Tax=Condylura cristata TaxID=143302 RepID=UPI000643397E|nr:PREDICTED: SET domain-containing protein 4 isoform X2 [Condylura cristata]